MSRRTPSDIDEVLGWVADEGIEGVVIHWPTPGFNAFALARRLQAAGGPRVVMTGDMRPETRFWAERNGCQLASDPVEALNQWGAS